MAWRWAFSGFCCAAALLSLFAVCGCACCLWAVACCAACLCAVGCWGATLALAGWRTAFSLADCPLAEGVLAARAALVSAFSAAANCFSACRKRSSAARMAVCGFVSSMGTGVICQLPDGACAANVPQGQRSSAKTGSVNMGERFGFFMVSL